MRRFSALGLILAVMAPGLALAAAPYGCMQHLSPGAKKVFDAVDSAAPGGTLRQRLTEQTRRLVMNGDLKRSDARPAAEEASACLRAR